MYKLRKKFLSLFLLISINFYPVIPVTEIRAVWLTTNWKLDWPSGNLNLEQQKKHLEGILDKLQASNFNTVFFQARIRGDVFYISEIEPASPFAIKNFDALGYAINECHKRGIECHAWFVTYPAGNKKQVAKHGKNALPNKYKNLCKFHNGEWYLDPGNPETRKYILSLVKEIVSKYDIDGIHFDYIRYPENARSFPDKDTYNKYGKGMSLEDWRRDNINILVEEIYDLVKSIKPWVQVSSAPLGKYKNLENKKGNWTAYESVYQDAVKWLKEEKHDALYPMIYYKDENFYPYLDDWMKNENGRFIVPGIGVYQMMPGERDWKPEDITDQIDYTRNKNIKGQAYFRTRNITDNLKGIEEKLKAYYRYPAKLPSMTWLDNSAPNSPVLMEVYKNGKGKLFMHWQPYDDSEQQTYTIYRSPEEHIDRNNPAYIIATGIRATQIEFPIETGNYGFYYSVTASDRFHNESVPCVPAFFSHSEHEK